MKRRRKKKDIKPEGVARLMTKHACSEEQYKSNIRIGGFLLGLMSKVMLERSGLIVDYRINGEDITEIEKLHELDISERIKLAVKEERYEDAMNLKKILDDINNQKQLPKND